MSAEGYANNGYALLITPYAGQPGVPPTANWMPMPTQVLPGCQPGLEYLTELDQILVHQQVEAMEVMTGWDMNNRFQIKNSLGQQCYYAAEDTEDCHRMICGNKRGFHMNITDNAGHQVFQVNREFKFCAGCCWFADKDCCSWDVQVETTPGNIIGIIAQAQSFWYACYDIKDANGQVVLQIKQRQCCLCTGPCCTCDYHFDILPTNGGSPIGSITKNYSGLMKECFTNATNFNISFPKDLDVKMKATLLGACFLINMMFFEYNNNNNN